VVRWIRRRIGVRRRMRIERKNWSMVVRSRIKKRRRKIGLKRMREDENNEKDENDERD
jgi:hypothetical protein